LDEQVELAVKQYGDENERVVNAMGIQGLDEQAIIDSAPQIVLQEHVLEEKRHKRLSSQEGFTVPKAKTNARTRVKSKGSAFGTPKTLPLARNVLRIVGTTRKELPASKPWSEVTKKSSLPVKKRKQNQFGTTGFFDSLGDMEA